MFLIASTGRCGTLALCTALNQSSDHTVEHEPPPLLLREAYLKHTGQPWQSAAFRERLAFFREHHRTPYGQSFRAPNLLVDIRGAAPQMPVLIIVRNPLHYILSAHAKRVFSKGNEWDQTRIVPLHIDLQERSLAEKIALHWLEVNRYLLDFADRDPLTKVVTLDRLTDEAEDLVHFLGVTITDHEAWHRLLRSKLNASPQKTQPPGYDSAVLMKYCQSTWGRANRLADRASIAAQAGMRLLPGIA